jgi:hypothetical protein
MEVRLIALLLPDLSYHRNSSSRLAGYWQSLNQGRTLRIIFFSGNTPRVVKEDPLAAARNPTS